MVFYPIFVNVNTKCLKRRTLEDLLLPTVLGRLKVFVRLFVTDATLLQCQELLRTRKQCQLPIAKLLL